MGRLLFGIPIPTGAVSAEVRPVFGPGQSRALFRGSLEENGQLIHEDAIADSVATDKAFWEYIDAQVRSGRIPAQKGIWTWKLSVKFLNQDGIPAILDPVEQCTSRVTSDSYCFYRAKKLNTGDKGFKTAIAALKANQAVMLKCLEAQGQVLQALPTLLQQVMTAATQAGCQVTQAAAQESAKLLQAGTAPLQQALALICEHSKHETARADDATLAYAKLLMKKHESDWTDDALKFVSAAPALLKLAEKLKN